VTDLATGLTPAHVLVVDDDPHIREMLREVIAAEGYSTFTAENGRRALDVLRTIRVDMVITDIEMPELDGLELLRRVKNRYDADVIVMTAHADRYTYDRIIERRAADFAVKPVQPREMVVRLEKALRDRAVRIERDRAHESLRDAHGRLEHAYLDTVHRLVLAAEYKDEDTGDHITRIQRYCHLIAHRYASRHPIPEGFVENILYSAPMHDIGKIGIRRQMLGKRGKLTPLEFEVVKTHTTIGAEILAEAESDVMALGCEIARCHHERWNGTGYPEGLAGDAIPLSARIVGLADVFDALRSPRPYKDAYPLDVTLRLLEEQRDRHFDPEVLDVFLDHLDDLLAIENEVSGPGPVDEAGFAWSERDRELLALA
jgi:putative two-component system response regulator